LVIFLVIIIDGVVGVVVDGVVDVVVDVVVDGVTKRKISVPSFERNAPSAIS